MLIVSLYRNVNEKIVPVTLKKLKYRGRKSFKAIEMDCDNNEQINTWCTICNSAYSDTNYSMEEARSFLIDHPLMQDRTTLLFLDEEDKAVATISYGAYKADPRYGGLFRIAVLPNCQGRGIGAYIISYGCLRLQAAGFAQIENIITYKRKKSLLLHYRLGFVPKHPTKCVVPLYHEPKSMRNKIQKKLFLDLLFFKMRIDRLRAKLLSHR